MEKDSKEEKDLGFFNGIKAEAIPLIVGLVSFTLLVENAVNNISEFLSISEDVATRIFVIAYFVLPVGGLIMWLTVVNYHDGLKKRVWGNRSSKYSLPFLTLIALLVLLCILFWATSVLAFIIVAALILAGVIGLAIILLQRPLVNAENFKREQYQANGQFAIVFGLLVAFWMLYFGLNFWRDNTSCPASASVLSTTERNAREVAMNECIFSSSYDRALTQRKTSESLRNDVNAFSASFQNYIYRPCPSDTVASLILRDSLTHSFKKIVPGNSCNMPIPNETKLKRGLLPPQAEFFSISNAELIKHQLDTRLEAQDKEYRIYWSAWLRTVQYRGLVLFALTTLFLLLVWYYAYTAWLDSGGTKEKPRENFSEINISKISIYIIFLLTIPFFKPITRDGTAFSKPYITFSNPLTLVDNRRTVLESSKIPEINYDKLADAVQKKMERDSGKLSAIEETVKRPPEKKSKKP